MLQLPPQLWVSPISRNAAVLMFVVYRAKPICVNMCAVTSSSENGGE